MTSQLKSVPDRELAVNADNGETVDVEVWPEGSLEVLSQVEVDQLRNQGEGGLYPVLRRCILAVLNSGGNTDDAPRWQKLLDLLGFVPS